MQTIYRTSIFRNKNYFIYFMGCPEPQLLEAYNRSFRTFDKNWNFIHAHLGIKIYKAPPHHEHSALIHTRTPPVGQKAEQDVQADAAGMSRHVRNTMEGNQQQALWAAEMNPDRTEAAAAQTASQQHQPAITDSASKWQQLQLMQPSSNKTSVAALYTSANAWMQKNNRLPKSMWVCARWAEIIREEFICC